MNRIAIIVFILFFGKVSAVKITGDYGDYQCQKFYIGKYEKGDYILLDEFRVDIHGKFSIDLDLLEHCTLLIVCGEGKSSNQAFRESLGENSIKLVYIGEDIEYKTSWKNHSGYLEFLKGGQSYEVLNSLNSQLKQTRERIFYIEKLIQTTSPTDSFFESLSRALEKELKTFNDFCDNISKRFPKDSYMSLYATMFKQAIPIAKVNSADYKKWKAKYLFDHFDLKNSMVGNIPLFEDMLNYYLYLNQLEGIVSTKELELNQKEAIQMISDRCGFSLEKFLAKEKF